MRILYATDGSDGARAVAGFLRCLPLSREDEIVLLAVGHGSADGLPWVERARQELADLPVRLEVLTRQGAAAPQILECARQQRADLVAVGAMGATGLARFFMGNVAERVVRHAECPILVGRPVRFDLRRALLAVDNSRFARKVADAPSWLPLPPATELRLATVIPSQETLVSVAPMVWASLAEELESTLHAAVAGAEERLRELARGLKEAGRKVTAEVRRGDPAASLLSAVDSEEVDLVILGSHGEGGVDRFLLGSVSERVARHAHCSVLVVR